MLDTALPLNKYGRMVHKTAVGRQYRGPALGDATGALPPHSARTSHSLALSPAEGPLATSHRFQVDTGRHLMSLVSYRKQTIGAHSGCHTFRGSAR